MARDLLDQQNELAERVRKIEINPGLRQLRTPEGWDPAYEPLDEISRVAYAMLPFCAFLPDNLPSIPPAAQYPAIEMWNNGFTSRYMSRAFMRGMLCCGGLCVPIKISSYEPGGMKQRVEGFSSDTTGENWPNTPNGRLVTWDTISGVASPPPTESPLGGGSLHNWLLGSPPAGLPTAAPAAFNEPSFEDFLGRTYGGYTGYMYWAETNGQRLQTIDRGTASWIEGGPPGGTIRGCESNQYEPISWRFAHNPMDGLYDLSGPTGSPMCFPNPDGNTELGAWIMAAADFDILAGGYWPVPPRYYMGEPHMSFDRSGDGNGQLIQYPGWDTWRSRVEEWCFGTPDWVTWALSWYRAHQPRLSVTGTPSQHWQRAATYLPWFGKVEYRIWQRVMYLRGRLYNPFHWRINENILSLPSGVEPVHPSMMVRVMGSNEQPYEVMYKSPAGAPTGYPHRLVYGSFDATEGAPGYRGRSPQEMIFDGCAIPIKHNPPYVP